MSFWGRFGGGDSEEDTPYQSSAAQASFLDGVRGAVGLQPTRREEVIDASCPSLTFKQRLWGFGICFGIGCIVSLGSMLFWHKLLHGNPGPFAINYTLGNLISVASTFFLMGPHRQLKRMSHPTRAGVALVFVLSAAATLVCAFLLPSMTPQLSPIVIAVIIVACMVVQFSAFFWYALSYIPYGRRMCKACFSSAMQEGV